MSRKKTGKVLVKALADILQADIAWTGGMLSRLGAKVDPDGSVDIARVRKALERLTQAHGNSEKINALVRAEMGTTQESCRLWLIKQFEKNGFKLLHREESRSFHFLLKRPDGELRRIISFVSLRTKTNPNQVGFTAAPGPYRDDDFFAFIAQPFGKAYLKSRKDMKDRWQEKNHTGPLGRISLTFSVGVDTDLFENRIADVRDGFI